MADIPPVTRGLWAMTIVSDLINLALKDSGVLGIGQNAQAEDISDTLRRLNMMLGQWSERRWLVYHLVDTACVCTGAQSYTVGVGGDFNIARPARIEAAYIRQLNGTPNQPVDFWLGEIKSREDYSLLALKGLHSSPSDRFFYDSDYPSGKLFPWPIPSDGYEVHIVTKAVLGAFATVADTVILPAEYEEAIYLNLMTRLRVAYRLPADKVQIGLAKAALNTIRRSNFQIGRLRMPAALRRVGSGGIFWGGGSAGGGGLLGGDAGDVIGIE